MDVSGPLLVQAVLLLSRLPNLSFVSMDRVHFKGAEWFQIADLDPLKCVRLGLQRCTWSNAELRFVLAVSSNVQEMVVSDAVVFPDMGACHQLCLGAWKNRLDSEWGENGRCSPTSITIDGRGVSAFWSLFGDGLFVAVCLKNVCELVLLGLPRDDTHVVLVVSVCCGNLTVFKCILPSQVLSFPVRRGLTDL